MLYETQDRTYVYICYLFAQFCIQDYKLNNQICILIQVSIYLMMYVAVKLLQAHIFIDVPCNRLCYLNRYLTVILFYCHAAM